MSILSEARRLRDALTLANVLVRANAFDWFIRTAEAQRHAEELLALSTEHALRYFWVGPWHCADGVL